MTKDDRKRRKQRIMIMTKDDQKQEVLVDQDPPPLSLASPSETIPRGPPKTVAAQRSWVVCVVYCAQSQDPRAPTSPWRTVRPTSAATAQGLRRGSLQTAPPTEATAASPPLLQATGITAVPETVAANPLPNLRSNRAYAATTTTL
jgi:hypothetical protein